MASEIGLIAKEQVARTRVVDFNYQFTGNLNKLMEILGTTRKIPVQDGTTLKALKVSGTLGNGTVAEGEIIPLSQYKTEEVPMGEAKLAKWRKSTSAESILKGGYDQAVGATTDKMVKDIQSGIRKTFIEYIKTATKSAEGVGFQEAIAHTWGVLQTLWEDDAVETVYFVNPLDVAGYLAKANITIQTAFGLNYVENFMGLGTVILTSSVEEKNIYATAKDNIVLYYVNVGAGDISSSFDLTTDETGYIGISEYADKDRACVNDLVMSGITFFAERLDGIVKTTINDNGA